MKTRNYPSADDKCESMNPDPAGTRGVGDGTTGGAASPRLAATNVQPAAVRVSGTTTMAAHGGTGRLDEERRMDVAAELNAGEFQRQTSTEGFPRYRPMPNGWADPVNVPSYGYGEMRPLDRGQRQAIAAELNASELDSQTSGAAEYLSSCEQGLRDEADALQRQLEELQSVVRSFSDREREEQFLGNCMPSVNAKGQAGTHSLSTERQFSGDPAVGRRFVSPSPTVGTQDHSGQTAGESSPVNCTFRPLPDGWGASTPTYGHGVTEG